MTVIIVLCVVAYLAVGCVAASVMGTTGDDTFDYVFAGFVALTWAALIFGLIIYFALVGVLMALGWIIRQLPPHRERP